jgi:hypothetical protein
VATEILLFDFELFMGGRGRRFKSCRPDLCLLE